MNIGIEYGNWLDKQGDWTYFLTIRKHYAMKEKECDKLAMNLMNFTGQIKSIWIALEKDRQDNMNHLHMLVDTNGINFNRKQITEAIGLIRYPKAVSYFDNVNSNKGISYYSSKHMNKSLLYHNLFV